MPSPARDRLVDTAAALFYEQGVTATGVDTVVARSGVAKATLYAHFHSKDDLVAAALERRHQRRVASLEAFMHGQPPAPRQRLLAVFDWLAAWHRGEGRRGCAFLNAAAEVVAPGHPALAVVRRHRRWLGDYLGTLAAAAGVPEPARTGADLLLLLDGASSRFLMDGDPGAAAAARQIAKTLLDARRR